jgi:hypothetical protein
LFQLLDRPFQFFDILARELPRLSQLSHHGLGSPSKETQNLIQETAPGDISRHCRLKDVGVSDLAEAPQGLLFSSRNTVV